MNNKPNSRETPLSSNFRKYHHRRIHTEAEDPGSRNFQAYYKPINK